MAVVGRVPGSRESKRRQPSKALRTQPAEEAPEIWRRSTQRTLTRLDKHKTLMYLQSYFQKARIARTEEVEKARLHNERMRRESFNNKDPSLKRRVVEKAKETLPGNIPSRKPIERA